MNLVSIDVLITTFNSEKYIKETINSVINQTYKNYKIVIVDDCSTDKTYDICKKFQRKYKDKISLFRLKKNSQSAAIPRNFGIKKCKSDFVAFLDSDDIWLKNKLERQVSKLNKSSKLIFSNCNYFKNKKKINSFFFYIRLLLQVIFSKLICKNQEWLFLYNPIAFSSSVISRKVIEEFNFNSSKNFVGIEDLELWFRLLKKYNKIIFDPKPLVLIRRRSDSLHSNYNYQTIKAINLISNIYLNKKNFININIFLFSIAYKSIRPFIKKIIDYSKAKIKYIFLGILFFIYLIFYSPIFKILGNYLLVETENNKILNNVVIYSGPEWETYKNKGYKLRYNDIQEIIKINPDIKIYILGRFQVIEEQRFIENLLLNQGFKIENIKIIYKDFGNSSKNLKYLYNLLKNENISEVLFVTSPYLSKRSKLLWNKFSDDVNIKFYQTSDWPTNDFKLFEKFNKKRIIIREYFAIIHNFFTNRL